MITVQRATVTLIQDAGRHGYAHVGVPASGAFNTTAYDLACRLLALEPNSPMFEILTGPLSVQTHRTVIAAVVGDATVTVDGASVGSGHVFEALASQVITVVANPAHRGPVYLAIRGLRAPLTLGSASWDTLSGLGVPPVTAGQTFPLDSPPARLDLVGRFAVTPKPRLPRMLRMIAGPHPLAEQATSWSVDAISRSGVRLAGHAPTSGSTGSLPSFPVLPGAVQLPPSGQPIILGPDCGVTGGYPVIGVLITADLPLLSRLQPGDQIVLQTVTLEQAARATAPLTPVIDLADLAGR